MTLRGSLKQSICKILLRLMETENLILDGILRNKMIYSHILLLTYTVGTVGRLLLDGRIPPRVKVNHIVRARKIQTKSSCLQTDEKDRTRPSLERCRQLLTLLYRSRALKIEERYPVFLQGGGNDIEESGKLTENQHAVTSSNNLENKLTESGNLCRFFVPAFLYKRHGTGSLTQTGDCCKRIHIHFRILFQFILCIKTHGLVHQTFCTAQCHAAEYFRLLPSSRQTTFQSTAVSASFSLTSSP